MDYKRLIVESGRRLLESGLTIETWGNISARDPENQLVYLTPSGMKYDVITEDDIVVCNLDGNVVSGTRKPTIEKDLHLIVYKNRPDANAIVHTHPMYSMVYASQGRDIPLFTDGAAQALGDTCRCADYALPGSLELAENCAQALGQEAYSCLLNSHGAVCLGSDMDSAFAVARVLEVTAQIYYMIEATGGKPVGISPENIAFMKDFKANSYGQDK